MSEDPMKNIFDVAEQLFGVPTPQVVTCPACKQKNRIRAVQLLAGRQPKCGKFYGHWSWCPWR